MGRVARLTVVVQGTLAMAEGRVEETVATVTAPTQAAAARKTPTYWYTTRSWFSGFRVVVVCVDGDVRTDTHAYAAGSRASISSRSHGSLQMPAVFSYRTAWYPLVSR